MIYLDSSALLKLLLREPETPSLRMWLSERSDEPCVSSELARVEVVRAIRRVEPGRVPAARGLLRGLDLVPLSGGVIELAEQVGNDLLRSPDALHLASALAVRDVLTAFLSYDSRLSSAARTAGLDLVTPGR